LIILIIFSSHYSVFSKLLSLCRVHRRTQICVLPLISISLNSFIGTPSSMRILYNTSFLIES
jgi:hypothetical protein